MGHIYFVTADKIKECKFGAFTTKEIKRIKKAAGEEADFPIQINNGETRKVTLKLPLHLKEQKIWMGVEGQGVKVTILYEGIIIGRLFANCDMGGINVCSGDRNRVWIPETGEKENAFVTLLVEAMEDEARLEAVRVILD